MWEVYIWGGDIPGKVTYWWDDIQGRVIMFRG